MALYWLGVSSFVTMEHARETHLMAVVDSTTALPKMKCGHPLAARAIRGDSLLIGEGRMQTECWACEVEAEAKARPPARPKGRVQW